MRLYCLCYNGGDKFSHLGAEIVFVQNRDGEYLSFYWQIPPNLLPENVLSSLRETPPSSAPPLKPLLQHTYLERLQGVISRKMPQRCRAVFCYDGFEIPFELYISPLVNSEGEAESVLVTGYHLKQSNQTAEDNDFSPPQEAEFYHRLLTSIARKIRRTLNLDTIGQQTVDSIGEALKVSRCLLLTPTSDKKRLKVRSEYRQPQCPSLLGLEFELHHYQEVQGAVWSRRAVAFSPHYPQCDALSVLLVPTFYQGELNGIICLHQCDRHRVWSEAEWELVEELADQVGTAIAHASIYHKLEEATRQAEEASRLKSEFLATTSHELRTPLNGIIGFLKLVLDDMADDPEEAREFIQQAYDSAIHLLNLINDILDIAKIEAGKMEFKFAPISLRQIFQDISKFAVPQAQKKNLYFRISLPPTYDEVLLYADYQRVLQVMLNVVGNALKFTHEGGIEVRTEIIAKEIMFHGEKLPGMIKITVEDTGIGVPLEKQERLFETFYQVDGSRTRAYGGTGLGLAISKRLVEAMGGQISFYSMGEDLGATVTITLPLFQLPVLKMENSPSLS
ncbi:MAG: ATP-binding protein [Geminocystis sp.]|nr:ATP-binding protein [Geminocystis sp.]HIK36679.1 GAF domain-containing protein [Geminocystis sp. M7585_C2015_104]MCS7148483.1 ATP-binding protein [Geminocystis sp.]MCX8079439.1 ATP-binding protein [Geminocystis sp.]MDW8114943.1 ATP-binding protein [Geminocystis sp.]